MRRYKKDSKKFNFGSLHDFAFDLSQNVVKKRIVPRESSFPLSPLPFPSSHHLTTLSLSQRGQVSVNTNTVPLKCIPRVTSLLLLTSPTNSPSPVLKMLAISFIKRVESLISSWHAAFTHTSHLPLAWKASNSSSLPISTAGISALSTLSLKASFHASCSSNL
jgi:hypothetical protein